MRLDNLLTEAIVKKQKKNLTLVKHAIRWVEEITDKTLDPVDPKDISAINAAFKAISLSSGTPTTKITKKDIMYSLKYVDPTDDSFLPKALKKRLGITGESDSRMPVFDKKLKKSLIDKGLKKFLGLTMSDFNDGYNDNEFLVYDDELRKLPCIKKAFDKMWGDPDLEEYYGTNNDLTIPNVPCLNKAIKDLNKYLKDAIRFDTPYVDYESDSSEAEEPHFVISLDLD